MFVAACHQLSRYVLWTPVSLRTCSCFLHFILHVRKDYARLFLLYHLSVGMAWGCLGNLLVLPDYFVDAALTDVLTSVQISQRIYWEVYSGVCSCVFLFWSHCVLHCVPSPWAGFFTFYCPLGIHLQTEWSPVFLVAYFPGSAKKNVLSRDKEGLQVGRSGWTSALTLGFYLFLHQAPLPRFPWGLLPL